MSRSAFDAHTDHLFKNLKILNLESIYKLQIGKFMYQYRSGLLPYSFNNMFLVTRQVHSYGSRSSEHFYLPQYRTNIRTFSISFQGPKFFVVPSMSLSRPHKHKYIYICFFFLPLLFYFLFVFFFFLSFRFF